MTNELEKTFFDTFGIEPKPLFSTRNGYTDDKYIYPQITDRIWLELICIAMGIIDFGSSNVEGLKEVVLTVLVEYTDEEEMEEIKQQVQALFEEGDEIPKTR